MNALPSTTVLSAALQDLLRNQAQTDELGAGITGGFAVVTYKGKVWRTKFRGDEKVITRNDVHGDGSKDPATSIEVVIIKASPHISKIFYEKGFTEGDMSPPDCWSVNGITPDVAAPKKQSQTCAGCVKNAFGSKITDNGKKAKACADTKRLAVVPLQDIDNETFGGPMLLRTPAASLKEVKSYSVALNQRNIPFYAVGTRVKFDPEEAFPKMEFEPVRVLTEREILKVLELRNDERVSRILDEAVESARGEVEQPDEATTPASKFDDLGPIPSVVGGPTPGVKPGETDEEREMREFKEMKAAKAKAAKEAEEAKAKEAAAAAAAEAAAAKPKETDEEREFREFQEAKRAKAAEAAKKEETPEEREFREYREAKAKTATAAPTATEAPKKTRKTKEEPKADAAPAGAAPKSFDDLLDGLVPNG